MRLLELDAQGVLESGSGGCFEVVQVGGVGYILLGFTGADGTGDKTRLSRSRE